jgi:hypothetical protein
VYSLCWNEVRLLPHYLKHYGSIAERFIIHDDGSTDGSWEMLVDRSDVDLVRFVSQVPDSFVLSALYFWNEAWKQSRGQAKWVVLCNIDEFVYHPDLLGYLERMHQGGVTVVPNQGFEMVSDTFPEPDVPLTQQVRRGVPSVFYSKLAVFDPNAIEDVNYDLGRHSAEPSGRVVYPEKTEVSLLHFKSLGFDYLRARQAELGARMRAVDISNEFGYQYRYDATKLRRELASMCENAQDVL